MSVLQTHRLSRAACGPSYKSPSFIGCPYLTCAPASVPVHVSIANCQCFFIHTAAGAFLCMPLHTIKNSIHLVWRTCVIPYICMFSQFSGLIWPYRNAFLLTMIQWQSSIFLMKVFYLAFQFSIFFHDIHAYYHLTSTTNYQCCLNCALCFVTFLSTNIYSHGIILFMQMFCGPTSDWSCLC